MKRINIVAVISLILLTTQITYLSAENRDFQHWMNELRSNASRVFQAEMRTLYAKEGEHVDAGKHNQLRLQGEGNLKKVPDPFTIMRMLFVPNGWQEDLNYAADGHGSSSTAYRKGTFLCITSVSIDSSCDDEETGHTPSKFWFSIECQELSVVE